MTDNFDNRARGDMTQKEATPRSRKRHQYGPAALLGALLGGLVAAPLAFLPAKWACLFARGLAVPAWWLATRRRRVTLSNFRYAYGHLWSEEKIRAVALESWKRVAVSAVEALQIRKWLADPQFHDRIVWSGPWEELESRHRDGESFLLVSGHLGPFEMVLPTLVHKGWRIGLLSRRIKNGYVHAAMNALRAGTVPEILDPTGALPEMGRALRSGTCLALLVDQNNRDGVYVPFMGRDAGTIPSIGVLTRRYRVPVIYLHARRVEDGRKYRLTCEIADLPEGENIRSHVDLVTREVSDRIENWVREVPSDWLWLHQRWKHRPDGSREKLI
ncbi:MAG: hypothetical protein GWP38_07875 [Planctomycetia bacterium]|nr:hypothetical protein [Planctomycetia bacterium]